MLTTGGIAKHEFVMVMQDDNVMVIEDDNVMRYDNDP